MKNRPKSSVFAAGVEHDIVSRFYHSSQDLMSEATTPDTVASKLAAEFTKAFQDAIEARGYYAVSGIEIETALSHDHRAFRVSDNTSLSDTIDSLLVKTNRDHPTHKGLISKQGQPPLRQVYLETGLGPEFTTPPAFLDQTAQYASDIKRAIIKANNPIVQRRASELPPNDMADHIASALAKDDPHQMNGLRLSFSPRRYNKKAGEHISFSLHHPQEGLVDGTYLDLASNNLITETSEQRTSKRPKGWARLIADMFTNHAADDYALLYSGKGSQRRLNDAARPLQDLSRFVKIRSSDRLHDPKKHMPKNATKRLEFSLPSAESNSHLSNLQVAAYLYLACKTMTDLHQQHYANTNIDDPDGELVDDAICHIKELHKGKSSLHPGMRGFAQHICERFDDGLLQACVKELVEELRTHDPERAEDLEAKFDTFKDAIHERTLSLESVHMGVPKIR